MKNMKKVFLIIITLLSLSCYDGLNGMFDELNMKVPICVDAASGSDLDDGRGWANAKQTIQAAVDTAEAGDEIWVAGDWNIGTTITVNESVSIYGGFNGTESRIEQRNTKGTITGNANPAFAVLTQNVSIDSFIINKSAGNGISITTSSCSADVINCNFTNTGAAAIFLNQLNSTINIKNCNFINNTHGAIIISNGMATIINSTFTGNQITAGGGAIFSYAGNIIISDCSFNGNNSDTTNGLGGAIYSTSSSSLTISASNFVNNYSHSGGAIYTDSNSSLTVQGGSFDGNYSDNTAAAGGAVAAYSSGQVSINNATFTGNHAFANGGAVYVNAASAVSITGCTFGVKDSISDANTASGQGGALYISGTSGVINNTDFYNNTAATGGGAIYLTGSSTLTINGNVSDKCNIYGNKVTTAGSHGGGLFVNSGTCTFTYCCIDNNTTNTSSGYGCGGGIYSSATCIISNSTISNNKAVYGGGFHLNNSATVITSSTINSNNASSMGGGFHLYFDSTSPYPVLHLLNTSVSENTAGSDGTALYKSETTGYLYIYNTLFTDKTDEIKSLVYLEAASTLFYISNSSLISHYNLGYYRNISFSNCILTGTTLTTSGGGVIFSYTGTDITGNAQLTLDGNKQSIDSSDFSNYTNGDYSLSQNSILINNGYINGYNNPPDDNNNPPISFDLEDLPTTDLAGNPRIAGGTIDIGCYERQ